MTAVWRRVAPWITPVLVVVEIVLVWTGVLSLLDAVVVIVVVEALLAVAAISRGTVAVRAYRGRRRSGEDAWTAAEDGLSELLPRPAARVLLVEVRMWVCTVQWMAHRVPTGRVFGYGANLRPVMRIVLSLVVFEAVVVEVVLIVLLGHTSPWVWLGLALHLYGLVWVTGLLASLRVLPHRIGEDALTLRDSVFTTVTVPISAVSRVQARARGYSGRSGFRVEDGSALLTYGDANVRVALDRAEGLLVNGVPPTAEIRSLDLSLDDAPAFIHTLREQLARRARPD